MESVSKLKLFNSIGEHKHKVQWMFLEPHTRIQVSQLTFKLKNTTIFFSYSHKPIYNKQQQAFPIYNKPFRKTNR